MSDQISTSVSVSPLTMRKSSSVASISERQRVPRAAGGAEHGLLPRIADPNVEIAAVADDTPRSISGR